MIELLGTMAIVISAIAYIVQYLLLTRMTSHFGPLSSKSKYVVFPEEQIERDGFAVVFPEHRQPVRPVDYLRRLNQSFEIKGNEWIVTKNADVWTCPFCLSLWMAFIGTGYIAYKFSIQPEFLVFIHLAIAFVAQRLINLGNQEGVG